MKYRRRARFIKYLGVVERGISDLCDEECKKYPKKRKEKRIWKNVRKKDGVSKRMTISTEKYEMNEK